MIAYKVLVGLAKARTSIPTSLDIEPKTLNAKSKGEFVVAYIELCSEDIDFATVRMSPIPAGKCNVMLTLTSYVNGKPFEGSSMIVLIVDARTEYI